MTSDRPTVPPALVLHHARAWIGTPYLRGGALRGVGADCVGLLRGLHAELAGARIEAPRWRSDWSAGQGEPILQGLGAHLVPVPLAAVRPGHVVTLRIGHRAAAHVGVWTGAGLIHATELRGVVEGATAAAHPITSAWAMPAVAPASGCAPYALPEGCFAYVLGEEDGHRVHVMDSDTLDIVAVSAPWPSLDAALDHFEPLHFLETAE